MLGFFAKKVNGVYWSTIYTKGFIVYVRDGPLCVPDYVIGFILILTYYRQVT